MKICSVIGLFIVFFGFNMTALAGPNDSQLTEREQTQQDIQKNRQEVQNSTITPNSKSAPTTINVDSWGLDSTTQYEITNHLFGYSTIMDEDTQFDGVKITGMLNVAFYSPRKNNDGHRKKSRLVAGLESPVWNLTSQAAVFIGGGLTFGDHTGLYADVGVDYYLLSWVKAQAGLNYVSGSGHLSPQLSLGVTW